VDLALPPEASLIRDTAHNFFREKSPVSALRRLRDSRDPDGFSREVWRQMAELGWAGFVVPEEFGGSAFGVLGLGLVMEAAGRTLAATPLLSTAVIAASALTAGGSDHQKTQYLEPLVLGEQIFSLALEEGPHHAPTHIETRAERNGSGFRLIGRKRFVLDGHVADTLIVAARTAGAARDRAGITLFLVRANAPRLRRTRTIMVDSRNAALIDLDGVAVGAEAVLGPIDGGADLLEAVLDRARAALAAEMLGASSEAFERIVQYLKDRRQFGVPIGSFQALKHRAARMFCEVELTRSAVLAALMALDTQTNDTAALVSQAKARANDTFFLVGNEGIQMHGGIGMTDEHEIGFFLKRARVAQATFGDTQFHRDRYATFMGY
jgi:alkylation response protein AidB-like acyl-CoA dehydrogenase